MTTPGVVCVAVQRFEAGAGEIAFARPTVLGEEVSPQPIHEAAKRRLSLARLKSLDAGAEFPDVVGEHRELRMAERTVTEKYLMPVAHVENDLTQSLRRSDRSRPQGQISWSPDEIATQRLRCNEAPIQEVAKPRAQTPFPELGKDKRDIIVFARHIAADSQGLIESL